MPCFPLHADRLPPGLCMCHFDHTSLMGLRGSCFPMQQRAITLGKNIRRHSNLASLSSQLQASGSGSGAAVIGQQPAGRKARGWFRLLWVLICAPPGLFVGGMWAAVLHDEWSKRKAWSADLTGVKRQDQFLGRDHHIKGRHHSHRSSQPVSNARVNNS